MIHHLICHCWASLAEGKSKFARLAQQATAALPAAASASSRSPEPKEPEAVPARLEPEADPLEEIVEFQERIQGPGVNRPLPMCPAPASLTMVNYG